MVEEISDQCVRDYQKVTNELRGHLGIPKITLAEAGSVLENLAAQADKMKICKKEGHVSSGSGILSGRGVAMHPVHDVCSRCGLGYERFATDKESQSYSELMNTRMTI